MIKNALRNILNYIYRITPTPLRMFAVIDIMFGLMSDAIYPVHHLMDEGVITPIVLLLTRAIMLSFGVFGLTANGKTSRLRAYFVSLPFIYLGILYVFLLPHVDVDINPIFGSCLFLILGIWIVSFGKNYEQ